MRFSLDGEVDVLWCHHFWKLLVSVLENNLLLSWSLLAGSWGLLAVSWSLGRSALFVSESLAGLELSTSSFKAALGMLQFVQEIEVGNESEEKDS